MKNNDAMYVVSYGKMCVLCGCTLQEYCVLNFSHYIILFFHVGNQKILQPIDIRNIENYFSNFLNVFIVYNICVFYIIFQ
jgi:hypothetical protein